MTLEPDEMAELDALDQAQEIVEEREPESVPCVFRTGKAGVGKTYWALRAVTDNPRFGLLTATTGIAAVNLGAVTLNSRLGYFDTESLRDAYLTGRLASRLHEIAREYSWLIVDEASMLGAGALDLLYKGVRDANRYSDVASPLGIALIGDFAQLPPVNEDWCFRAQCWPEFARGTVRMTEVFRQAEGPFLSALNLVREGHGGEAAEILSAAGARWNSARDDNFDGTTIVPVNQQVSRHNEVALLRVKGQTFTVASRRWGKERREWGLNPRTHEWGIPPQSEFRIGAYVMILTNSYVTVPVEVLRCTKCGYTIRPHETSDEDMRVLSEEVHTPENYGIQEPNNPQQARNLLDVVSLQMGKEDVSELAKGHDGEESKVRSIESGRNTSSVGRVHSSLPSRPPEHHEVGAPDAASGSHGKRVGETTNQKRNSTPSEWDSRRQSARESSIGDLGDPSRNGELSVLPERIRNPIDCPKCGVPLVFTRSHSLQYCNGDCGHVVEYRATEREVVVRLVRTGQDVTISPIVRAVESGEQPDGWTSELRVPRGEDAGGWLPRPHFRARARRYVEGQIEYYPLRLAYASSVHKSQSLTLDRLQVDFRHWFFGREAMLYVALSRCRTLEGLRLVGTRETFVKQCRMDMRVKEWL